MAYVHQTKTSAFPDLTVYENMIFASLVRLPNMSLKEQRARVSQVMEAVDLTRLSNVRVGGDGGSTGLSGGQQRRLAIAIEMLTLAPVIFLDEPTSGLDAASSLDVLTCLHTLALSGRTVVVTIHQPRMEIYQLFDRVYLMASGRDCFFGPPEGAVQHFHAAITDCPNIAGLEDLQAVAQKGHSLTENRPSGLWPTADPKPSHADIWQAEASGEAPINPADFLLDVLSSADGKPKLQEFLVEYWQRTGVPQAVREAVTLASTQVQRHSAAVAAFQLPGAEASVATAAGRLLTALAAADEEDAVRDTLCPFGNSCECASCFTWLTPPSPTHLEVREPMTDAHAANSHTGKRVSPDEMRAVAQSLVAEGVEQADSHHNKQDNVWSPLETLMAKSTSFLQHCGVIQLRALRRLNSGSLLHVWLFGVVAFCFSVIFYRTDSAQSIVSCLLLTTVVATQVRFL